MNDLETIAVAKVIKKSAIERARTGIDPGQNQVVDVTVRISGTINVGEGYDRTPTVNIPILDALALAIHDAGITGKFALAALKRAMTRALEQDDDAKRIIQEQRASLEAAEIAVRATLDDLPKVPCNGTVTTKLTVETLELVPA